MGERLTFVINQNGHTKKNGAVSDSTPMLQSRKSKEWDEDTMRRRNVNNIQRRDQGEGDAPVYQHIVN